MAGRGVSFLADFGPGRAGQRCVPRRRAVVVRTACGIDQAVRIGRRYVASAERVDRRRVVDRRDSRTILRRRSSYAVPLIDPYRAVSQYVARDRDRGDARRHVLPVGYERRVGTAVRDLLHRP